MTTIDQMRAGRRELAAPSLQTSAIELRERLNGLERDWLLACLRAKRGVHDVLYDTGDSHRLLVQHDAEVLDATELLDFLFGCGVYPEPAVDRPLSS